MSVEARANTRGVIIAGSNTKDSVLVVTGRQNLIYSFPPSLWLLSVLSEFLVTGSITIIV